MLKYATTCVAMVCREPSQSCLVFIGHVSQLIRLLSFVQEKVCDLIIVKKNLHSKSEEFLNWLKNPMSKFLAGPPLTSSGSFLL